MESQKQQMTVAEALEAARDCLRQGKVGLARKIGRQLARALPTEAATFHLLGQADFETGVFPRGLDYLEHAVRLAPAETVYRDELERCRQRVGIGQSNVSVRADGVSQERVLIRATGEWGARIGMAACLPTILEQTAECYIETDASWGELLQRSCPRVKLADESRGVEFEREFTAAEAAAFFGGMEVDGGRLAYLNACPIRVASVRRELERLGSGLRIGVHRGFAGSAADDWWRRLPEIEGGRYFVLDGRSSMENWCGATWLGPPTLPAGADAEGWAALLSALDLVIGVPDLVALLGGAVGVPTWVVPVGAHPEFDHLFAKFPSVEQFGVRDGNGPENVWNQLIDRLRGARPVWLENARSA